LGRVNGNVINNVSCHGNSDGKASGIVIGGGAPFTYSWTPSGGTGDTASGLTAGTYTITVNDACANTSSASVTITQPTAINISSAFVNETSSAPCNGQASAGVSGGISPYTYSWTGGGTTDTIKSLCSGGYCCRVTDHNGCVDSACVTITNLTGVNEVSSNSGSIMIYPNPNNGQFTVRSTVDCGASLIEIYNVLGEKISSASLNTIKGGNSTIDISSQPNGVYVYKIISKTGALVGVGNISVQK